MPKKILSASVMLAVLLALLDFAFAQDAGQNQTLIVDGHPGQAAVVQVKGHSYADLEALARILNGSLSFNGNQIILRLPASASSARPPTSPRVFSPQPSKRWPQSGNGEVQLLLPFGTHTR